MVETKTAKIIFSKIPRTKNYFATDLLRSHQISQKIPNINILIAVASLLDTEPISGVHHSEKCTADTIYLRNNRGYRSLPV